MSTFERVFANLLENCNWIWYCHHHRCYRCRSDIYLYIKSCIYREQHKLLANIKTLISLTTHHFENIPFKWAQSTFCRNWAWKMAKNGVWKWKAKKLVFNAFVNRDSERWYDQQVIYNIYRRSRSCSCVCVRWHLAIICITKVLNERYFLHYLRYLTGVACLCVYVWKIFDGKMCSNC